VADYQGSQHQGRVKMQVISVSQWQFTDPCGPNKTGHLATFLATICNFRPVAFGTLPWGQGLAAVGRAAHQCELIPLDRELESELSV
jgi:hypothetical protein